LAKLTFRYSAMCSGKSAEIIQICTNYSIQNMKGLVLLPEKDSASKGYIKSRIVEKVVPARTFKETSNLTIIISTYINNDNIQYIIIDEANFLTKKQVDELASIVDTYNINILAYGLMTNFKGELFEGSKRLVEIADKIENIYVRSRCICGKTALFNARFENGKFCDDGKEFVIDENKYGNVSTVEYRPLCRKCFMKYKNGK